MKDGKLPYLNPRSTQKRHKCPKCGKNYRGYPALSRDDNETEICPICGTVEAIEYFLHC